MKTQEKPKQVVYSPVEVDGEAVYTDLEFEKSEEQIDWETFREEMRESNEYAKITVYRQPMDSIGQRGQKKLTYLFDVGLDEYQYSQLCARLRDEYGTGTYRMQGRDSENKLRFNRAVTIEAPKVENEKGELQTIPNIISEMRLTMNEQQAQMAELFKSLAGPQTGGDAFKQMTEMMTAMGGMMAAMGLNPKPQKTFMEEMTQFQMMQEMFSGGNSGGGNEANLYSLLTATMQSFGGPIAAAIAAGQSDGVVNAQGLLENPKDRISAAPPLPVDKEKIKQEQEMEALKGQIKILVANAEAKTDAVRMANLIVEKTPEASLDSLFEFLSGDDYLAQMIFLVPEVKAHESWFIKLRDTVLELLTESDDPPIVPESDEPDNSGAGADAEPDHPADTVAETTGSDISDETNGDAAKDT